MCLALSLILGAFAVASADAGLFGLWGSKKKVVKPPRHSLVVFPFDQGAASKVPEGFGEFIASDARTMLAGDDRYLAFMYRDRLAPIERAKADNVLKTDDMKAPFAGDLDKSKTLKLAQILAADLFLVGEIDDFQVDRTNKVAEMTLKADLYDGKTGKLMKTFLVTGRTPESMATGEEDELRDVAKGAAVTKLIAEITAPPAEEAKPAPAEASAPAKPAEAPAPAAPPPSPSPDEAPAEKPAPPPAEAPPPPAS
jgi:hypothetical protein